MEAAEMPRPRPPFLQREIARGKVFWYVRRDHGPRIRLHAPFGTPEFWAEYEAALAGRANKSTVLNPEAAPLGSLAWLVERYRETSVWCALSLATRRQRENIFKQVLKSAGALP